MKAIGVWLAQAVLVLTGNLALAASLKLLGRASRFPLRIVVEDNTSHLELLSTPSEWDQWVAAIRRCGVLSQNNRSSSEEVLPS
jgi:hypothetical protein